MVYSFQLTEDGVSGASGSLVVRRVGEGIEPGLDSVTVQDLNIMADIVLIVVLNEMSVMYNHVLVSSGMS